MANVDLKTLNESQITDWLEKKVKKKIDSVSLQSIKAGRFYSFNYDSKLFEKEKIDFFDTTPLIFVLSKSYGRMLGLNFHYLPIKIRQDVIKRLQNRYKVQWPSNKILPNCRWEDISKELKYSKIMVKLYINTNVRNIVNISTTQMESLVKVRSEDFTGIRPEKLWSRYGLT